LLYSPVLKVHCGMQAQFYRGLDQVLLGEPLGGMWDETGS